MWADAPAVAQRLDLDGEATDIVLALHEAAQVGLPAALVGHREVSGRALDRALNGTPLPGLVVLWLRSGPAGRRRLERYVTRLRLTAPTITGHDLRAAGVPDGPAMAVGLQAACEVRRDGPATRQAQLQAALAAIREWQRPARRAQRKG
ncbi:hypothetical protein FJY71_09150 [candidate division WOR-3 bacterium]|nr:hypothetical protein [candidate division WOR-3 bacterium]